MYSSIRPLARPWTKILIRSSGSLSIRMMMPTVPTGVNVVRLRVFHIQGFLGGEEQHAVARERGFDRLDRHLASDKQREHHVRKHDDISDRQQGQLVRRFEVLVA
jgi:hypothetical protein